MLNVTLLCVGKLKEAYWRDACAEYEKRLRKPFDIVWTYMPEEKLDKYLAEWPFGGREYVICCDERGQNISSPEFSAVLEKGFAAGREIVILIGGAYGFTPEVREQADFVWSFSKLVYPHGIARVVCIEQIYRASQILAGGPYHHE